MLHGLRTSKDAIVETFRIATALAAAVDVHEASGDDAEGMTLESKERLQNQLAAALTRFTPSPVGLASGHMDAVSKAAAATHSLALACDDLEMLSVDLRSCRSLTTDMGTEMSLAQLHIPDFSEFAPSWLRKPATDIEAHTMQGHALSLLVRQKNPKERLFLP